MTICKTRLKEKVEKIAQEEIKIAFFGQPGAGKSSTINAICGKKLAKVGVATDTTQEVQIIKHGEVILVDLPGYGTSKFPQNEFFTKFNPLQYDLFICVFAGKWHEADNKFFRELNEKGKTCILVRNKTDEIYDADQTLEQAQENIRRDVAKQLGTTAFVLLFISARNDRQQQGIAALNACITSQMQAARKEKYIMAAKAQTREHLQQKKSLAAKYVNRSARFAAANGLNPIMGVDTVFDLSLIHI